MRKGNVKRQNITLGTPVYNRSQRKRNPHWEIKYLVDRYKENKYEQSHRNLGKRRNKKQEIRKAIIGFNGYFLGKVTIATFI